MSLVYVTGDLATYEPVGNARLLLDTDGGVLDGKDISGEYVSGTSVVLPEARFDGYVFRGWTDGAGLYRPGETYTVTGVVTLKTVWDNLVRNRQVLFDANGGTVIGNDPGGMYADGEVITIPKAGREERELSGWELGGTLYAPGARYTVDNSVVFIARWKEAGAGDEGAAGGKAFFLIALLAALLCLLVPLLWRRKFVRYSLRTGNILLKHRENRAAFTVRVFLSHDGKEYLLGTSETVRPGETLAFIPGQGAISIAEGEYRGRLHITFKSGGERDVKCRLKVLDKDLEQGSEGQA